MRRKYSLDLQSDQNPKSVEKVLKNGTYAVPRFQRNYKWKEENWDELLQTIESSQANYLGTIFLLEDKKERDRFEIIDGQQRLTTISILIKALELRFEDILETSKSHKSGEIRRIVDNLKECRLERDYKNKLINRLKLQDLEDAEMQYSEIMNFNFNDILSSSSKGINKSTINAEISNISTRKNEIYKERKEIRMFLNKSRNTKTNQELKDRLPMLAKEIAELKARSAEFRSQRKAVKESREIYKEKTSTQKRLLDALDYFVGYFARKNDRELIGFYHNLIDNQYLITIKTKQEESVFDYFKSLNATGVKLTTSDIVKNNLFKYHGNKSAQFEKAITDFERLVEVLDETGIKLDDFLMHSMNARKESILIASQLGQKDKPISRENLLLAYDILLKSHKIQQSAEQIIQQLVTDLRHYLPIVKQKRLEKDFSLHELERKEEVIYFYQMLSHVVPSKPIALLLASRKKHNKSQHLAVCKAACYISIRHVIMPRRDMKQLEGVFMRAKEKLFNGNHLSVIRSFKDAQAYKETPDKDSFSNWNWSNSQAKALNFMLFRKEIMQSPKIFSSISSEHIMPLNPNNLTGKYWFSKAVCNMNEQAINDLDAYHSYAKMVGNQILMHVTDNKALGNKTFSAKRQYYKKYPYRHIKTIGGQKDWTQKDIVRRSEILFKEFEKLRPK